VRIVLHRVRSARLRGRRPPVRPVTDGLVVMVGFGRDDDPATCRRMAGRVVRARVFPSPGSMLGVSARELAAAVMVVSQMPLVADTARGAKPNLAAGAAADVASSLYATFAHELDRAGAAAVEVVPFGSSAELDIRHWGPFTLVLDG
jgi:D-tyrosyl-tRNA(Tyr) deacylase